MTDRLDFEARLEERLRARAALASRPFDAAAIAHQAAAGKRGRWSTDGFELPTFRPAVGWLIVAMLLAIALLGVVASIGGLRLFQRDPVENLSLEPPSDVQALVLSSRDRLPELQPVAMTRLDDGTATSRIYVDRSGAVRIEQYASADATHPDTYIILSGNSVGSLETVGSEKVWVVNREAIGDDPRIFIPNELASAPITFDGPGCDLSRNEDEVGNETAATGWSYVGAEDVAGRPTHHVTCGGSDLWLDGETGLILRARSQHHDDSGQPIPGELRTMEVTEIAFGEQPASLFDMAPAGVPFVPAEDLDAYRCARDPVCASTPPSERPEQHDSGVPGNEPTNP
jgi:hypothetical protein